MAYPPLENLLPKSKFSIYRLVRMAALRATELADGSPKLIQSPPEEKTATIALEEIQAGLYIGLTTAVGKSRRQDDHLSSCR